VYTGPVGPTFRSAGSRRSPCRAYRVPPAPSGRRRACRRSRPPCRRRRSSRRRPRRPRHRRRRPRVRSPGRRRPTRGRHPNRGSTRRRRGGPSPRALDAPARLSIPSVVSFPWRNPLGLVYTMDYRVPSPVFSDRDPATGRHLDTESTFVELTPLSRRVHNERGVPSFR
jgi:hypothetical protein